MSHLNEIFQVEMHFICIELICESNVVTGLRLDFHGDCSKVTLFFQSKTSTFKKLLK